MSDINNFIDQVVATHGGLPKFKTISQIDVSLYFSGAMLELKGYAGIRNPKITMFPQAYQDPTSTTKPWVIMTNLSGDSTNIWKFTPNRVWIEAADGSVLQERYNPRSAFIGQTLFDKWDDLQLLYFFFYACYNYLSIPFNLTYPGFEIKDLGTHQEFGDTWRTILVTHPADHNTWPSHIQTQKFYFGEKDKLLKRMDYVTELFGGVAAHYVSDYRDFGGLLVPTLRRVVGRIAKEAGAYSGEDRAMLANRTGFLLSYDQVKVQFADGTVIDSGKRVS